MSCSCSGLWFSRPSGRRHERRREKKKAQLSCVDDVLSSASLSTVASVPAMVVVRWVLPPLIASLVLVGPAYVVPPSVVVCSSRRSVGLFARVVACRLLVVRLLLGGCPTLVCGVLV